MEMLLRLCLMALGGFLGFHGASYISLIIPDVLGGSYVTILFTAVGALIGLFFGSLISTPLNSFLTNIRRFWKRTPTDDILGGVVGLVLGLLVAMLVSTPLKDIPVRYLSDYLPLIISAILGLLGWSVGVRKRKDILGVVNRSSNRTSFWRSRRNGISGKILDTSVIIDGRIADITKSGFIEGVLIVPQFVLEELQHIADSSDVLKRNRGRRGLDILNKIQKEPYVTVQIMDIDYDDITEVDSKLVRLAKETGSKVITNDYNLNKVCELQQVAVLNINELANAVKPVVLPGEELRVHVIKDGKEQGQGIAYLDDGTMIVVDGGRRYIGDTIGVLVTSVLQTAAGRMIFAKPKAMEKAL